jgi:outer membrane protein TolC
MKLYKNTQNIIYRLNCIILAVGLLFIPIFTNSQTQSNTFTLQEFMAMVKKYHPQVKQANLLLSEAEAELLKARGAFDPKIEVDFDQKEFKNSEYYSVLQSSFKIPTWYGIEVKAGFDNSEGIFLNPQNVNPNSGLTSLGLSIPVARDLLINKRMADLRKAKLYSAINQADSDIMTTEVIAEALTAYLDWKMAYDEYSLYDELIKNADIRFQGIKKMVEVGQNAAIDSVEAKILVNSRKLNLQEAELKFQKSRLFLSNYLWLENNVPIELAESLTPEKNLKKDIGFILNTFDLQRRTIDNHPKIVALNNKINVLKIEERLKTNNLLPQLDVSFHWLNEPVDFTNIRNRNYKAGVNFSLPIFLRKERGERKLAQIQVQDSEFELNLQRQQIDNKIKQIDFAIANLNDQLNLNDTLVNDFNTMLKAEERLFQIGESSVFLVNTRENSYVSSLLKYITTENKFYLAHLDMYRTIAIP